MSDLEYVKGLGDLQRVLSELPDKLQEKTVVRAASAGAKVLQDEMTAHAPVRKDGAAKRLSKKSRKARLPGYLKASISRRRVNKGSGTSVTYEVGVLRGAFYASFFEFGTRHQPARPFVRPAVETKFNESVEKMAEVTRADIDRANGALGLK